MSEWRKVRKKPVEVEAWGPWRGLFDTRLREIEPYHGEGVHPGEECEVCKIPLRLHGWIGTLEGGHRVCVGDYIIRGVKGELYPCKPDVFAETYEAVTIPCSRCGHGPERHSGAASYRGSACLGCYSACQGYSVSYYG